MTMKQRKTTSVTQHRDRRIGRKVLLADRLHKAVPLPKENNLLRLRAVLLKRWKVISVIGVIVILIGIAASYAVQSHTTQLVKERDAAAAERLRTLAEQSASANACRQEKAAQKSDLIGKVSYDELYDYDACDK